MREPRWIPADVARTLHAMQIVAFGGTSGILDGGFLESALARPKHLYHYEKPKPPLARLAASYAFGIVRNHPFLDGNKRMGLVTAFTFLKLNGIEVLATEEDAYQVFMSLASGSLSETELSAWIEENSTAR